MCIQVLEQKLQKPLRNKKLDSLKQIIIAQSYEANENKQLAIYSYTEALKQDPTCIEAFNSLINQHLLKRTESRFMFACFKEIFRGVAFEHIGFVQRGSMDKIVLQVKDKWLHCKWRKGYNYLSWVWYELELVQKDEEDGGRDKFEGFNGKEYI